ncbi:MAG TPA: extracellular solute-binding protein [Thermoguttaceae bacterium]|nr:extracellular solute-binding protein [Thermoguttaceae bacterium]
MSRPFCVVLCVFLSGCWSASGPEVIVYTALDSEFSEPILEDFTAATGIAVRAKFDVESTKTVGLTNAIFAESGRPRCDVFWNNEILQTLRLEREGLLEVYRPPIAEEYPESARSPDGTWHGFAARARVLIVHEQIPEAKEEWPTSIHDLTDSRWKGRACIAKPLFGSTATHAACLFAYWGDEKAKDFFRRLKANDVAILSGNKHVAVSVAAGEYAFGLTDTDDAMIEIRRARPATAAIVYPDQGEDGMGTLFFPNTLAIIKGGPNVEHARRLVDYLLSRQVEARLAAGPSVQIPLNPNVEVETRVETPRTIKAMRVDFPAAAGKWDTAREFLRDEFAGG